MLDNVELLTEVVGASSISIICEVSLSKLETSIVLSPITGSIPSLDTSVTESLVASLLALTSLNIEELSSTDFLTASSTLVD